MMLTCGTMLLFSFQFVWCLYRVAKQRESCTTNKATQDAILHDVEVIIFSFPGSFSKTATYGERKRVQHVDFNFDQ